MIRRKMHLVPLCYGHWIASCCSCTTLKSFKGIQKMVQQAVPLKSQDIYHPVSTEESAAEYPARKNVEAKRSYDFKVKTE
ncbi:hypothetical protein RND71_005372 [Anisodus tanguticus]|uniref:Uncharacterized protein n=1 Tax=Anisodus tanguticus TaxID=243964 RepID=A0AAE1VVG2_9SOLA|nr:hypothetical protein RND71_005372 [Anisodus tanguticus]